MKTDAEILQQWNDFREFTEDFIADHWNQLCIRHKEAYLPDCGFKQWEELTGAEKDTARPEVLTALIFYVKSLSWREGNEPAGNEKA